MPASFPTSIKSFSTRSDNTDTVFAAHINELQDEVAAIETELGVNPSDSAVYGTFSSVDARLEALEAIVNSLSSEAIVFALALS